MLSDPYAHKMEVLGKPPGVGLLCFEIQPIVMKIRNAQQQQWFCQGIIGMNLEEGRKQQYGILCLPVFQYESGCLGDKGQQCVCVGGGELSLLAENSTISQPCVESFSSFCCQV